MVVRDGGRKAEDGSSKGDPSSRRDSFSMITFRNVNHIKIINFFKERHN